MEHFMIIKTGNWCIANRNASYRVKNSSPKSTYMEIRVVSAAANVYLVMAGIIAAGIDGIDKKMELPPEEPPLDMAKLAKVLAATMAEAKGQADGSDGTSTVHDVNITTEAEDPKPSDKLCDKTDDKADLKPEAAPEEPEAEDPNAPSYAKHLEQALELLQADEVIAGALGETFINWFVFHKKNLEAEKLAGHAFKSPGKPEEIEKERKMYYEYI